MVGSPSRGTVPLFQGIGEYLYVTRDPDSILDSQTVSLSWLDHSFFFELYPRLRTVRHDISLQDQQTVNQERLLALNPGAVFVFYTVAIPLRRVGLPALGLTQPVSAADVFERARVYAQALGQTGRVAELMTSFQSDIDDLRQTLGQPPERPSVAEIFVLPTGAILLTGNDEADRAAFEAAGVISASPSPRTMRIGAETLLRLDPAIILLLQEPSPSPAAFMAEPRWAALSAVRHRSVYRRPLGANGGFEGIVEYPLFARWLADLSHPVLPAQDLRRRVAQRIAREFADPLSDTDIDTFLDLAENSGSAGYVRFARHAP